MFVCSISIEMIVLFDAPPEKTHCALFNQIFVLFWLTRRMPTKHVLFVVYEWSQDIEQFSRQVSKIFCIWEHHTCTVCSCHEGECYCYRWYALERLKRLLCAYNLYLVRFESVDHSFHFAAILHSSPFFFTWLSFHRWIRALWDALFSAYLT